MNPQPIFQICPSMFNRIFVGGILRKEDDRVTKLLRNPPDFCLSMEAGIVHNDHTSRGKRRTKVPVEPRFEAAAIGGFFEIKRRDNLCSDQSGEDVQALLSVSRTLGNHPFSTRRTTNQSGNIGINAAFIDIAKACVTRDSHYFSVVLRAFFLIAFFVGGRCFF